MSDAQDLPELTIEIDKREARFIMYAIQCASLHRDRAEESYWLKEKLGAFLAESADIRVLY